MVRRGFLPIYVALAVAGAGTAAAQQVGQPGLEIGPANRTLMVSAEGHVTVPPEVAVVHVGFDTQPESAKAAYAEGAKTSNAIVGALKGAGVAESAIHSEYQYLDRVWDEKSKTYKFKYTQQWTVKTTPEKAAEVLDTAVTAGATSSGQMDWTVKDENALADKALTEATTRARAQADALARGMGVKLGALLYVSNSATTPAPQPMFRMQALAMKQSGAAEPPSIEPHEVTRDATVYAVYAIE